MRCFLYIAEIENNVRRCLKIIKSLHPSRDGHVKRKAELIQLVEDIHKEYQSLYALYDNLRGAVRKKVHGGDETGSCSSRSSTDESFHTPEELIGKSHESNSEQYQERETKNLKSETPDSEDSSMKDKLMTSTSELEETLTTDSMSSYEVPESMEIFKDLKAQIEQSEGRRQKLLDECARLKDNLVQREEEVLSITKKQQAFEAQKSAEIEELESKINSLNLEIQTVSLHKRAIEEKVEGKSNEAKQLKEENAGLQARILELESISKVKEDQFSSLIKKSEEDDHQLLSESQSTEAEAKNLLLQMDTLSHETAETSVKIHGLIEQTNFLQQELECASRQKTELELQLREKCEEISECHSQIEKLEDKLETQALRQGTPQQKERLEAKVKELELEVSSLFGKNSYLEDQIIISNGLKVEKEELERRILELETILKERDNELSTFQKILNNQEDKMCTQITSLRSEISNFREDLETLKSEKVELLSQLEREKEASSHLEKENIELKNKVAEQRNDLIEQEDAISKLNEDHKQVQSQLADSKSSYQLAEKKMEEMAEEFCKKCEDNVRILSRRIRVAEQLHLENKEWYEKTKHIYETENKSLKEKARQNETWLKQIKEISLGANELLSTQDAVALRFEECTANFLNRISKVSCELKFAKDWVCRKNKAIGHVKDDLECLLAQLDDKEAEILVFREKLWKSENKVRELEKVIIEREEGMLTLMEEKREAIRQLCVWIDYHRSRSDYYKKMISEITAGFRKTP